MQVGLFPLYCRSAVPDVFGLQSTPHVYIVLYAADVILCTVTPAELWDKHHVHAELQQEKANLWTKKEWPTWNPCNQTELDRNNGYWAVSRSAISAGYYHACTLMGCICSVRHEQLRCASAIWPITCKHGHVELRAVMLYRTLTVVGWCAGCAKQVAASRGTHLVSLHGVLSIVQLTSLVCKLAISCWMPLPYRERLKPCMEVRVLSIVLLSFEQSPSLHHSKPCDAV